MWQGSRAPGLHFAFSVVSARPCPEKTTCPESRPSAQKSHFGSEANAKNPAKKRGFRVGCKMLQVALSFSFQILGIPSDFRFSRHIPSASANTLSRCSPLHSRNSAMSNHDELDCPKCRTELISCICGCNKLCPRCTFRILTLPCSCPDGLAKWRFQRTDTLSDFIDHLLPPTGSC